MNSYLHFLRASLAVRILAITGITLFVCLGLHAWLSIRYQHSHAEKELIAGADRMGQTILLGTRYAMMGNARHELNQIISDVAEHPDIVSIRIYNKAGEIKFSNHPEEVDTRTDIRATACHACHVTDTPKTSLTVEERIRVFDDEAGAPRLGSLMPIKNEKGCAEDACHAHEPDKIVLGALDVVLRADSAEQDIITFQNRVLMLTAGVFLAASTLIIMLLRRFITRPAAMLIDSAKRIGRGERVIFGHMVGLGEMGELATALARMQLEVAEKREALERQRKEYQHLFEQVPCSITVQDRDYKLIQYNREFAERFNPASGIHCYEAYKGRTDKCPNCPVEKTFATGLAHCSEESRVNPDGTRAYWLVHTSPVFDDAGNVVAAMEMSLDISARRAVEERLRRSEQKYHAIFDNIPNSVFVLDAQSLEIIDCNTTAELVYGVERARIRGESFLSRFSPEEQDRYASQLRAFTVLNRARNFRSDGSPFYVDIMLSPAEYHERQILLVTTNDITERLETERKLIQAGKMATLGEMATGVAHELNQPLTVIKTASSFIMRKIRRGDAMTPEILQTMAAEIDSHVDRASQIINHMREFGRQSDLNLELVDLNVVLRSSFEFFYRQLSSREISVEWNLDEDIPLVLAMPNRLEQVFMNLLLNARDAIEERSGSNPHAPRRITLTTKSRGREVEVMIEDTGTGIPKSLQNKIFEPFFTTKKVGKGTGLGLSISYGLVRDFGGSIQAENTQGSGARFTLKFPSSTGGASGGTERAGSACGKDGSDVEAASEEGGETPPATSLL
ncbi:PAS domain S-box protein [Desulfovibrio mangrovi]|uniref:ATP-binding protein n=1 Tax=Desulfovibrio mangrovi TaxID=2976983 RepID=UPI002247363F|nr:ATP-binding protein [Desulfovibrio mangrovi]UZP68338.1 PAS domain S-box protein [Desulfovibrio mangrovi]